MNSVKIFTHIREIFSWVDQKGRIVLPLSETLQTVTSQLATYSVAGKNTTAVLKMAVRTIYNSTEWRHTYTLSSACVCVRLLLIPEVPPGEGGPMGSVIIPVECMEAIVTGSMACVSICTCERDRRVAMNITIKKNHALQFRYEQFP